MEQITIREFFSPFEKKKKKGNFIDIYYIRHSSFVRLLSRDIPSRDVANSEFQTGIISTTDPSSFDLSSKRAYSSRESPSLSLSRIKKFQFPFDSFLACRKREIPNGRNFHRLAPPTNRSFVKANKPTAVRTMNASIRWSA